ncbi:MAG TPA: endonuclease/exonuclease/phosphatase family protein [Povalibacter sp.]|uniref:endonuclease/exonuclease/phosphatase family protein n=1 Tax=Povalibacter sp. TaxID=1962978 RepID=UPI002BA7FD4B|nr:endonuclease/exonuclease/phosphatase family protein [Povalibacter sp.]HMN46024.1 endonuclease/exonuclease/phosphatase family protein [Povalibacter sp.]
MSRHDSWLNFLRRLPWCLAASLLIAAPATAQPLRVMTFNIRLLTPDDGANHWDLRRDLAVRMLRSEAPDIIGTQELFKRQGDELVARLPEYVWFGTGRRGGDDDEHMGIFYRKDRLRVLDSGNFWLSDTPDTPGSRTWGNLYPRLVTWARFKHRADGATFTLYNTHFPYRNEDETARLRSAKLIRTRLEALPRNENIILTGDFNTTPDGDVHALLTALLADAWTTSPERSGPDGTFHDFTGRPERRIDWILFRGPEVLRTRTVTTHEAGRYPSDHFAVVAEFELGRANENATYPEGHAAQGTAEAARRKDLSPGAS